MKMIAFCKECVECFKHMPGYYWTLYTAITERYVEKGHCPLKMNSDYECSCLISHFIQDLEEKNIIVTCDTHRDYISVRPCGLHSIELDDHPGDELVQVCLDIERHHDYEMDENDDEE